MDANGYLASVTNPAGEQVRLSYDADGLLKQLTDARQGVQTFAYDSLGRIARTDDPAGGFSTLVRVDSANVSTVTVGDAAGRFTSYRTEEPAGKISRETITDPLGRNVMHTQGPDGSFTSVWPSGMTTSRLDVPDPRFGMAASYATNDKWTTPGGITNTLTRSRGASLTDASNPWSFTTLTETIRLNGRTTTTTYDRATRRLLTTSPEGRQHFSYLDAQGRVVLDSIPGLRGLRYAYDAQGRLSTVSTGSLVATIGYDANGRPATIVDPAGRIQSYAYDAAGRLKRQVFPDSTPIEFAYDSAGNLTSVLPAGRSATTLGYSPVNLLSQFAQPAVYSGEQPSRFAYNGDRTLASITRPGGATIQFEYDGAGALASIRYGQDQRNYTYAPSTGVLTRLANGSEELSYAYDGELLKTTTWSGAVAGLLTVAYDSLFRPASVALNSTPSVAFAYDRDGLLTAGGSLSLTRDAQTGLVRGSTLGGITTSMSYDSLGLPQGFSASYAGSVLFSRGYTRDRAGRIAGVTEVAQTDTTVLGYVYDGQGRLTTVRKNGVTAASYEYDPTGNRTRLTTPQGTMIGAYDGQDRLLSYGDVGYAYDLDGNRSRRVAGGDTTTYSYDDMAQLTRVGLPDGHSVTFTYDGRGRRIAQSVDASVARKWLYFDQLHVAAELDASDSVLSRFLYDGTGDVPAYMINGGNTYRLITDQLGSVRLVVDVATGEVKQRLDYDEFGRVLANTNPGFQPFGYAGGIEDEQTGLVHFGARDYDPSTGRWLTKDPELLAGDGPNLYAYVGNDPVDMVDPSGLGAAPPKAPPNWAGGSGGPPWETSGPNGPVGRQPGQEGGEGDGGGSGEGGADNGNDQRGRCPPYLNGPAVRREMNAAWKKTMNTGFEEGGWIMPGSQSSPGGLIWVTGYDPATINPGARPNGSNAFLHTHPAPPPAWQRLSPDDSTWANNNHVSIISVARDSLSMLKPGGPVQSCAR